MLIIRWSRCFQISDGSVSTILDPGQVNFLLLGLNWVRLAIFGLGFGLENFP